MGLLVLGGALSSVYAYLAWFKPERLKELGQPPKLITNLLGRSFGFLWQGSQSDLAIWVARLVGPLVAAMILTFLVAMFLHALGL
jgi:hypothetical protein